MLLNLNGASWKAVQMCFGAWFWGKGASMGKPTGQSLNLVSCRYHCYLRYACGEARIAIWWRSESRYLVAKWQSLFEWRGGSRYLAANRQSLFAGEATVAIRVAKWQSLFEWRSDDCFFGAKPQSLQFGIEYKEERVETRFFSLAVVANSSMPLLVMNDFGLIHTSNV